jgi:hypothetical protein
VEFIDSKPLQASFHTGFQSPFAESERRFAESERRFAESERRFAEREHQARSLP